MEHQKFFLKGGYVSREEPLYFDDRPLADGDVVHQPDAYLIAHFIASRYDVDTIIDIGSGNGRKLMALEGVNKIGVDFGCNLEYCRQKYPTGTWIEADLERGSEIGIDDSVVARSIVICADVIEHLVNPENLLNLLRRLAAQARAIVLTTPERDLVRGIQDMGPPANPSHIREWSLTEFDALLRHSGLPPTFIGLTVNNNKNLEKKTILAIVDNGVSLCLSEPPQDFHPLAIIATYNDRDVAPHVLRKLLDDEIDLHILDNWLDDGSYDDILSVLSLAPSSFLERFPSHPERYYEWKKILDRKAQIAAQHVGRWIIHQDSDEVRLSPWFGISLRKGLWIADQAGFNAVDFTVLDFRPVNDTFTVGDDPEVKLRRFEFGRRPGHFKQVKAWKQGPEPVSLSPSGGHDAQFSGRRVFPYKFILKHYPFRNSEQARRKVLKERKERFSPREREMGWHIQYDQYSDDSCFLWNEGQLVTFDDRDTRNHYMTELISGIGIVR